MKYVRSGGSGGGTSIGGTVTNGTPGSVVFIGGTIAAPTLAQDNQGINYNDSLNRLSVFTTLGSEVVSNGTFTGSASGWTVGSGWSYSSNTVVKNSNGTSALTQSLSVYALREYLLTYTISNWTVGTVTPSVGSFTGTAVSANGTYTERFVSPADPSTLSFTPSNTARFTIDSVSVKSLLGTSTTSNINTGGLSIEGNWANGSPGTTRGFTYNNDGSYSWTDYRFSGVLKAATGANSSGGYSLYVSGGNGVDFYNCNSGLSSCSLYSYNYQGYFQHYGYAAFYGNGQFGGSVGAGTGAFGSPTSTLQSAGGTALKVKRITASQTLDNTATHWLSDGTTAAACTGTPSVSSCSTYTASGQATCESHLPCTWYAGASCSAFNYESGMGTCGGTSGCTVDQSSCVGPTDQSSCESQDDSYGGTCTWSATGVCAGFDESTCLSYMGQCSTNYFDCTTLNGNESSCSGHTGCSVASSNTCGSYTDTSSCNMASPCSAVVDGDCTALSDGGGDGTACATKPECSYDGGSGACTGYYFTSCSGDNSTCSGAPFVDCTGNYNACSGNYNNGNCSGTYGMSCNGTVTCGSYSSSGPCGSEAGCTWASVLLLELPNMLSYPDRTYFISNDASGGADTRLIPPTTTYPATTINGGSYLDLTEYQDGVEIAPYATQISCSTAADSSACTALAPYGCSVTNANCTWNSGDNTCNGHASCSGIGDQGTCEGTQYYSGCSGNYYSSKDWRVYAERKKKAVTYGTISYDNEILRSDGTTGVIQGSGIIASDGGYISWAGTSPTARLHLPAGTATAGTAPLKFVSGTVLTTPEAGTIEYNSGTLYFTDATPTRQTFAFIGVQQTWAATQIFKHSSGSSVPLRVQEATTSPTADLQRWEKGGGSTPYWANLDASGLFDYYGGVQTNGKAFPTIYKVGRSTGQTAAVASVAAYTNAAADGTFEVSANVLVTTSTVHSFTVTVAYTDEGNTARTLTLPFTVLAGTSITAIANAAGAVPYAGIPVHIRCKASTAITIATTGTFTTVTYNVEGIIKQTV